MTRRVALIVAAGRGIRAGTEMPKQYRPLAGRPVLRRTVRAFLDRPGVDAVLCVIHPADRVLYDAAVGDLGLPDPVAGGATRQASVHAGLERLAAEGAPDQVLIHDAARPFVDAALIDRAIGALDAGGAGGDLAGAIPVLPVHDTLKRLDGSHVGTTVPRDGLWRAQTPQIFTFSTILTAHRATAGGDLTDDAAVAEAAGMRVGAFAGAEDNVKLTTPEDFERAERRLDHGEFRTASGFDVHRFDDGDAVTLCGVQVPHDRGLAGHSDADVGLHALTDALLGTIGAGDIGGHFPPSDPRWRGADSALFLSRAAELVAARGARVVNVDVTLVCERPRIGPHRAAMVTRIAEILGIDPERVSVKATTTEGLGFTGRGEGIAAQATATIRLGAGD